MVFELSGLLSHQNVENTIYDSKDVREYGLFEILQESLSSSEIFRIWFRVFFSVGLS